MGWPDIVNVLSVVDIFEKVIKIHEDISAMSGH